MHAVCGCPCIHRYIHRYTDILKTLLREFLFRVLPVCQLSQWLKRTKVCLCLRGTVNTCFKKRKKRTKIIRISDISFRSQWEHFRQELLNLCKISKLLHNTFLLILTLCPHLFLEPLSLLPPKFLLNQSVIMCLMRFSYKTDDKFAGMSHA